MRILLACEESQAVCKEFRALGHEAYSCDIQPCSGGHPEWHFQSDVREALTDKWDMVIAFPPCTHLAVSGARHFAAKQADGRQQQGIDFFMLFTKLDCPWAIENPIGIMSSIYRKPNQIIQPWQFGDEAQKSTCLWLNNLPNLIPKNIVGKGEFTVFASGKKHPTWYAKSWGKGKVRSKTFPGIAKAMAEQWGTVRTASMPQEDGLKKNTMESLQTANNS